MSEIVTRTTDGTVAVVLFDDGKANAFSHQAISLLNEALEAAARDGARALVLEGRPGRFCAGFDLGVMRAGPEAARELVAAGAETLLRLYEFPAPVVVACSGHALAAGAVMLLCGDLCIGVEGEFKIGLNEVQIGMPLPLFAVELARARLLPTAFTEATLFARIYDPDGALGVGYLHRVVRPEQLHDDALAHAHLLARSLVPAAFQGTRARVRGALAQQLRETLRGDLASFSLGA